MSRVRLIHWHEAEAQECSAVLAAAGYEVDYEPLEDQAGMRRVRAGNPEAVVIDLSRTPAQGRDLTICFVCSRKDLGRRLGSLVKVSEQGHVWIAWPKKASSMKTDLSQAHVRQTGLDAGLVDFKICAIDDTWSGLCFALRRR